jgi:tripartite-type tricarboxylate transporter receptor subunit TctC
MLIALTLLGSAASAQSFPSRPVRIVTSQVGGLNDFTARVIAQSLSGPLGKPVIVENRGLVALDIVAKASPDGHTLLCFANNLWLLPFLQEKATFDPVRDFAPITLAVTAPNVLAVHASVPATSVKDLIALAKARPGTLNYGAGVTGGTPHLAAELFKSMAGIDIVRVGYKGTGPALTAIAAGEIQMIFAGAGSLEPHVRAGRVKALAVTSAAPSALATGLPTISESGLPGYEATAMIALLAPARTPAAIVKRLNEEIVKILARPDVRERLMAAGVEAAATTPARLGQIMKSEMVKWGSVIREAGIRD